MHKTQPTMAALIVNQATAGKGFDLADVFRSLEGAYHLHIRLTHTGIIVRSRGAGRTVYVDGDYRLAKGGKAVGSEQCAAMRTFAVKFISWADTHGYSTPALQLALKAVSNVH